jgi:hypothetical protein
MTKKFLQALAFPDSHFFFILPFKDSFNFHYFLIVSEWNGTLVFICFFPLEIYLYKFVLIWPGGSSEDGENVESVCHTGRQTNVGPFRIKWAKTAHKECKDNQFRTFRTDDIKVWSTLSNCSWVFLQMWTWKISRAILKM